ncbi:hypothetical protein ACFSTC_09295 [Nonomuraea ferruginea]
MMRWRMREVMAEVAGERAPECVSRYERHYLEDGHRKVVLYQGGGRHARRAARAGAAARHRDEQGPGADRARPAQRARRA